MCDAPTVSHNEITAIAGKAIRGLNNPWCEPDLIGPATADLDAMALNGVARLADALPQIAAEPGQSPGLPQRRRHTAQLNLQHRSAWCHLPSLATWLTEQDYDELILTHCRDTAAGIALLRHTVTPPNHLELHFHDHTLGTCRALFRTPGQPPDLYLGNTTLPPDTTRLRIHRHPQQQPPSDPTPDITTEQLLKRRLQALRTGLSPSANHWQTLHHYAKAILVPTSVQSESGAGE